MQEIMGMSFLLHALLPISDGSREHGYVFFCLMPLKYTGLQGPEKRDELQPPYAYSMRSGFILIFGTIVKA
jgi:hypothetical protein